MAALRICVSLTTLKISDIHRIQESGWHGRGIVFWTRANDCVRTAEYSILRGEQLIRRLGDVTVGIVPRSYD